MQSLVHSPGYCGTPLLAYTSAACPLTWAMGKAATPGDRTVGAAPFTAAVVPATKTMNNSLFCILIYGIQ